jgi:hypothetical protein
VPPSTDALCPAERAGTTALCVLRQSESNALHQQRNTGPSRAMDDALRVLGDAIARHDGDDTALDGLRDPIRQFCLQAKREQLPPEQLLVSIKRLLDRLPVSYVPGLTTESSARSRLITFAIKTYYDSAE